jgi:hypothetical protein
MLLTIAIAAVSLGAFFDGWSTNLAIRKGAHEANPLMVKIFGTNKPDAKTTFLRGTGVISCESFAALAISHFHPHAAAFFATAFFIQTAIHGFEAYRGFTSKAAN